MRWVVSSSCETAELDDGWILYQLTFVRQEGTRDTAEDRMLTFNIESRRLGSCA